MHGAFSRVGHGRYDAGGVGVGGGCWLCDALRWILGEGCPPRLCSVAPLGLRVRASVMQNPEVVKYYSRGCKPTGRMEPTGCVPTHGICGIRNDTPRGKYASYGASP